MTRLITVLLLLVCSTLDAQECPQDVFDTYQHFCIDQAERCKAAAASCDVLAVKLLVANPDADVSEAQAIYSAAGDKYQYAVKKYQVAQADYIAANTDGDRLRACANLADTVAIFGDVENEFKLAERKLPIKDASIKGNQNETNPHHRTASPCLLSRQCSDVC